MAPADNSSGQRLTLRSDGRGPAGTCVCVWSDVTQVDSGNYTCEIRGPYSSILGQSTHYLFVRGENVFYDSLYSPVAGSVAGRLACWTRAQKGPRVQIAVATLSRNSLRQTVHTRRDSVHQAAKLVAALLRVARVTAGLAESNGSLPPGL